MTSREKTTGNFRFSLRHHDLMTSLWPTNLWSVVFFLGGFSVQICPKFTQDSWALIGDQTFQGKYKYISCTIYCEPFIWYTVLTPLFSNLDYEGFHQVKKDWILDGSLALQKARENTRNIIELMKNIRVIFGTCSQMLNVWPIYQHLGSFGGKCR